MSNVLLSMRRNVLLDGWDPSEAVPHAGAHQTSHFPVEEAQTPFSPRWDTLVVV